MTELDAELTNKFDPGKLLGYLNFSDGRPDNRFRKLLADVFASLWSRGHTSPWQATADWLLAAADRFAEQDSVAFRDTTQARFVVTAAFHKLPTTYRQHHADLLAHQSDAVLFNAFFLARGCEAVLQVRSKAPAADPDRAAKLALGVLNDYVGYRPIAILETRPQTEYYPHEKVSAVPVYWDGVGVAPGPFEMLVRPALDLLAKTDPAVREEAGFELAKMEELAVDPRAADHFHPVTKRPNVLFGEWDPHRIDAQGYYRRFILRQPTLDALMLWAGIGTPSGPSAERLYEAACVLAGTVLMGAGVSGAGPTAYDSTVALEDLVKRIARYRDEFYKRLLEKIPGAHGDRLRQEAVKLKQPFAGVRQFLNQSIATERALHLQERRLAMLFAAMGYPTAARERAAHIPAAAVRFGCEIRLRQTFAEFAGLAGRPAEAADQLAEAEDLLKRGIDCGALVDPWNILGYQGLFPIFPGRDDTVRDPRAEELVLTLGRQFDRYAAVLAVATTAGDSALIERLTTNMRRLADWWDKYATAVVSDMPRVIGHERTAAAIHVATALANWRSASDGSNEVAFWRRHRDGFTTPVAFAQVIEALLDTHDFKGARALLVTWLAEAPPPGGPLEGVASSAVPLQDASASFYRLVFRWLTGVLTAAPRAEQAPLIRRMFELLEANGDARWEVPSLTRTGEPNDASLPQDVSDDETDNKDTFASAYDGMSYQDSADDGNDGAVADEGPKGPTSDFALEASADPFEDRLRFLTAMARLWRTAARPDVWSAMDADVLTDWFGTAARNRDRLTELLRTLHAIEVPAPDGDTDGMTEYDRRRSVKGHLLDLTVTALVETNAALRSLASARSTNPELSSGGAAAGWSEVAVRLERAITSGDTVAARPLVSALVPLIKHEPLLLHPPTDGGPPEPAVRVQSTLQLFESLLSRLPRLGLLRETYHLLKLARVMERNSPPKDRRVSSFDQLFRTAVLAVTEALVTTVEPGEKVPLELSSGLRQVAESFHRLWLDHSQSLRLSALESVLDDDDWEPLKQFIRTHGSELFTVRFLTLSNVRGILAQGVENWLDQFQNDDRPTSFGAAPKFEPTKLLAAWTAPDADRSGIVRHIEIALQALVEHNDEYRDYNTTTTQSDYGENLYILLDFLRLKVAYDRFAWRLKPLVLAHQVLCRRGHDIIAASWREYILSKSQGIADDLLGKLTARETEHGMKVRTVRNRLEERFVLPLQVDQAAAKVARAAAAARDAATAGGRPPETSTPFIGLLELIRPLSDTPTGVGLEIPSWLRRLEEELWKFRTGQRTSDGEEVFQPSDDPLLPPAPRLRFNDLKRQLSDWEKPLGD